MPHTMVPAVSVKPFTTFAVEQFCQNYLAVHTAAELYAAWQTAQQADTPALMLGGGSNVLFVEDFAGTVMLNRLMGVSYRQTAHHWHIHAAAGENWHQLVTNTLAGGVSGLENLALIPGCAGAAPIQNIGAYGVEFARFCEYVDCLDLSCGQSVRLSASDCHFAYRDSIFKQPAGKHYAIVAVGLQVNKHWQPVLDYGDLLSLKGKTVTPDQLFQTVCAIRRRRLPDPALSGNAGSFFKNPQVTSEQAARLLAAYPQAPHYPQADGTVKLAAGWLIDQCQLKGVRRGDAAVHERQALVLVNLAHASGDHVVQLARQVRQKVAERFAVWLEPEVRFIGRLGEVDAVEWLQ